MRNLFTIPIALPLFDFHSDLLLIRSSAMEKLSSPGKRPNAIVAAEMSSKISPRSKANQMKNKKAKTRSPASSKIKPDAALMEYLRQFDNYYKALNEERPITVDQLDPLQNEIELMLVDTVKRIRQYERDLTKVDGDNEELETSTEIVRHDLKRFDKYTAQNKINRELAASLLKAYRPAPIATDCPGHFWNFVKKYFENEMEMFVPEYLGFIDSSTRSIDHLVEPHLPRKLHPLLTEDGRPYDRTNSDELSDRLKPFKRVVVNSIFDRDNAGSKKAGEKRGSRATKPIPSSSNRCTELLFGSLVPDVPNSESLFESVHKVRTSLARANSQASEKGARDKAKVIESKVYNELKALDFISHQGEEEEENDEDEDESEVSRLQAHFYRLHQKYHHLNSANHDLLAGRALLDVSKHKLAPMLAMSNVSLVNAYKATLQHVPHGPADSIDPRSEAKFNQLWRHLSHLLEMVGQM